MLRTSRVVPGRTDDVVIVGAGLGGLSAALRLAGAGRRVTVVEQSAEPGGRAGVLRQDGYQFDTGPTVLTMPELIDDALACVGERLTDRLELLPLSPAYRAVFADGSRIDVHTDPEQMAAEIAEVASARDVAGYRELVRFLHKLYQLEQRNFIDRNLDSPLQLVGSAGIKLLALGGLRRLAPKVGQYLADDRLRRIFSFQAMYAGLAPQDALAIYAVIAYMDTVAGVYFPRGGMHAVSRALADAAADHGVTFRYNTKVERIEVSGERASAVLTCDGDRLAADVVVVNADLPTAYERLLPDRFRPRRLTRLRYSPSCVLVHAGSRAHYPDLAHHSIFFGQAWDTTFSEIIDEGRLMSDPSFLVSNPSRTDSSLAPPGRASYYVLFPCPNTRAAIDWSVIGPRYRDEIMATLDQRGLPGFEQGIEVEAVVTPQDWQDQGLAAGAPFAAAHTFAQSGPFRFPTLDRQIENLVFCGSNTQPGVGVPMVLLSGRLAAARITGG
ncbi:MAG TPA: phytoene desaturase family protein [Jatrophihabitans sp.]|jgi:phytoene desaturase|uniref:phytoene desaturase family protein n=1 Tax=Jatrophihabitans sp. TaxID=1932789 RepID=UPI002F0EC253